MIPRRLATWGKRPSKYGNRRIKMAGVSFDSVSEQRRWEELKLLQAGGAIRNLTLHPKFSIEVNGYHICNYVADFRYQARMQDSPADPQWQDVVEDLKAGVITQTDVFRLKRKLMLACYGIAILITGESN